MIAIDATEKLAARPPKPVELLRLQRGLAQHDMAASLGITPSALYRIEQGRVWPSPPRILALADLLSVEPEELCADLLRGWRQQHPTAQP